jgi:CRP/FNR family transcriptional regulator, cyclic AMP receptor protein
MESIELGNIASYRKGWPPRAFLSRISADTARTCFSAGHVARYEPREVMIREGEEDRTVHLLLAGCVKVTSALNGTLLAVRTGGDIVGELSTIDGERRSASVQVCSWTQAVACAVDSEDFMRALDQEAHVELSKAIVSKFRAVTRRRIDMADCTPVVRMARLLVELAHDYGEPSHGRPGAMISMGLTQEEFGELIGVSKPTAHRALGELRRKGLVNTASRPLIIHDVKKLRTEARLEE